MGKETPLIDTPHTMNGSSAAGEAAEEEVFTAIQENLNLKHAIFRNIRIPVVTDPLGEVVRPVTFEQNCQSTNNDFSLAAAFG